jgi:hypothetical protein
MKKVKLKWSRYRPGVPQRVGRGIALLFHARGTRRWVSGQGHAPAALYPRGKTRYPLYRRLGGPQGRSGRVREISYSPGFDPGPSSPQFSRYTDWATGPTNTCNVLMQMLDVNYPVFIADFSENWTSWMVFRNIVKCRILSCPLRGDRQTLARAGFEPNLFPCKYSIFSQI